MALPTSREDLERQKFIETPAGSGIVGLRTATWLYSGETVAGSATSTTAPPAGTALVTIAAGSLPAGAYLVTVFYGYGGTADVVNNFQLKKGAAVFMTLHALAAVQTLQTLQVRLTLDGATALTINNNTAGGVGTIFLAAMTATPIYG